MTSRRARVDLRALLALAGWLSLAPAASAGRGGPDAGGWLWADSTEPGVTNSIDNPASWTSITDLWNDEEVFAVPLSFSFTLYGVTSNTVWISSNGWISLRDPGGDPAPGNGPLPAAALPNGTIAYAWGDLTDGFARHGATATGHVILVRHTVKATGQLIQIVIELQRAGGVKVHYVVAPGGTVTVGIEDEAGAIATELYHAGTSAPGFDLVNDVAVLFYPGADPSCAAAPLLACPDTASGSTVGGSTTGRIYGCAADAYDGAETAYRFTLSDIQEVTVDVTRTGARDVHAHLLRATCDARIDCVAGGAASIGPTLLGPGDYYVVIDGLTPADDGTFDLSIGCGGFGQPIACNSMVSDSIVAASGNVDDWGCWAPTLGGGEKFYTFSLATPMNVTAVLTSTARFDVILADPTTLQPVSSPCLEASSTGVGVYQLPAGDHVIAVDGPAGTTGNFDLQLDCSDTLPTTAIECSQSVPASNDRPGLFEDYPCSATAFLGRGEIYYTHTAAPNRQILTLTPLDAGAYDVIAYQQAAFPDACLGFSDGTMRIANVAGEDYLFLLDSASTSGVTSLTLQCDDMAPTPIACDSTVSGTTGTTSDLLQYDCSTNFYGGAEAYFELSNPTGVSFAVAVTPTAPSADLDVFVFDGPFDADLASCAGGGADIAVLANPPPGDYLIAVDSTFGASDDFDLTVVCGASSLDCAGAPDLACGASASGDTAGAPSDSAIYGTVPAIFSGPEEIYRITNPNPVPIGFQATLTAASDPKLDLILISGCDPSVVLAYDDTTLVVPDLPPGDSFLVVDGRDGVSGTYSLETGCSVLGCVGPLALSCSQTTVGDTSTATNDAFLYEGCSPDVFDGPELVYHFRNDQRQTVSFLYDGPPELSLLLVPGDCDASSCILMEEGERLIARNLDPGDYYLVVDGRGGAAGAFEITPICDNRIDPTAIVHVLQPGDTVHQVIDATFSSCDPPRGDVVFAMDVTGSMSGPIANLKVTAQDIINELDGLIDDVQFGLVSFRDYDGSYSMCSYSAGYGGPSDDPYRLELPVTSDLNALFTAIDGLNALGGGDVPEAYLRVLSEMYEDAANIGWRTDSRQVVVMIGDAPPHSCDTSYCGTPRASTGIDPGRDGVTPSADDLDMTTVLNEFVAREITPVTIVSGFGGPFDEWQCWMQSAAGAAYLSVDGTAPPTIVDDIVELIEAKTLLCEVLELRVTPGFETWVTNVVTSPLFDVQLPGVFAFEYDVGPPLGTPPGTYTFQVEVACDGDCSVTQDIEITVPQSCVLPDPQAAAIDPICEGGTVTLDASASTGCSGALEFQWLDGATIVPGCEWSSDPTCDVTPAGTTTYTVQVGCQAIPGCIDVVDVAVEVVPFPAPALGAVGPICVGDSVSLDASATDPRGCPVALDYRFLEGATEIRPWGPDPVHGPLVPGTSTSYTVEARCTVAPGCGDSASTSLDVVPPPTAVAGADVRVCEMVTVNLDASGSVDAGCPAGLQYEWRDGATVVRPWAPDPTWSPPTVLAGTTVYTVHVRCAGPPGCEHSDDVTVRVDLCTLAVDFERYGARRVERDGREVIEVSWRTLLEDGTIGFLIERSTSPSGPYATLEGLEPLGAHRDYVWFDVSFDPSDPVWYRIVELTGSGRGDETPPFTVDDADEASNSTGGRRRSSTRR